MPGTALGRGYSKEQDRQIQTPIITAWTDWQGCHRQPCSICLVCLRSSEHSPPQQVSQMCMFIMTAFCQEQLCPAYEVRWKDRDFGEESLFLSCMEVSSGLKGPCPLW